MRRLMLLRHAKTENDAPSGKDQDRRLDDRGRLDAAEIGRWMAGHPPFPDSVLVSTAVRSQQTWDIVWDAMSGTAPKPTVELLVELYGADPSLLLQAVHTLQRLVVVPMFDDVPVLRAIQDQRATEIFLVPTMIKCLIEHPRFGEFDVTSLRLMIYGAAPIDGTLLTQALRAFPNAGFYQA